MTVFLGLLRNALALVGRCAAFIFSGHHLLLRHNHHVIMNIALVMLIAKVHCAVGDRWRLVLVFGV